MARYSYAWTVTGVSAAALSWLRTTTAKDMRIWEIGVFMESGTAAATTIGFGRPAAISSGPTTVVPQAEDTSAAAAACTGQVAAGTSKPTAPTLYHRRFACPAVLGAGMIWTFPQGFVVPAGPAEAVLFNIGASTSVFGGYWVYEE